MYESRDGSCSHGLDELFVNVESVVSARVPAWLKTAALRASRLPVGGFTVGVFLGGLSDEHMSDILQAADDASRGDADADTDLKLLALMLANGEALPVHAQDNVSELARRMLLLVQAEHYQRKGCIVFNRAQLSLATLDQAGLKLTRKGGRLVWQQRRAPR